MRTIAMLVGMMVLGGCSAQVEGQAQRTEEAVQVDAGDAGCGPAPCPGTNPEKCPSGFHACSLGTVGYACDDTSWYYCAAAGVACETPEPCVPLPPKTLGLDAGR